MTLLSNLNARLAAKKAEAVTPLEHLGNAITKSMVANTTAVFTSIEASRIKKGCSATGKVCPNCGKVHPEDQVQGNQQQGNQQQPQQNQQQGQQQPQNVQQPQNDTVNGNGQNTNPTNMAQPQIVNASSMVQSMGSALKHPVQVNHDASGVGVTHAAMLVHPEWNQGAVKDKIHAHLTAQNWKSGKGTSGAAGSKTYESPEGHKIHVAPVGKHLIVSAEDKKGTAPTPYTPPQKPIKKSGDPILDAFEEGIFNAISTIDGVLQGKGSTETI